MILKLSYLKTSCFDETLSPTTGRFLETFIGDCLRPGGKGVCRIVTLVGDVVVWVVVVAVVLLVVIVSFVSVVLVGITVVLLLNTL